MWKFTKPKCKANPLRWIQYYKPKGKENKKCTALACLKGTFGFSAKPKPFMYPISSFQSSHGKENGSHENNRKKCNYEYEFRRYCTYSSIFETIGWVGAAFTLGLNLQLQFCPIPNQHEIREFNYSPPPCNQSPFCSPFSKWFYYWVFSMPGNDHLLGQKTVLPRSSQTSSHSQFSKNEKQPENKETNNSKAVGSENKLEEICEELKNITTSYISNFENLMGIKTLAKNPKKALQYFKASAECGCDKAYYNLGVCYEMGRGTEVDLEKAAAYYERAAAMGHSTATYNLGVYYMDGRGGLEKNTEKGIELIAKSAKQGITKAQTFMGAHYQATKEWQDALGMLNEASAKNDLNAKYYLALSHENGWGVPVDLERAQELFLLASSQGHPSATYSLATYYENGLAGLKKNHEKAVELYRKAADLGHSEAQAKLLFLNNTKVDQLETNTSISELKPNISRSHKTSESGQLHMSSSSPELSQYGFEPNEKKSTVFDISQYLGLILPSILKTEYNSSGHKVVFNIEDTEAQSTSDWNAALLVSAHT